MTILQITKCMFALDDYMICEDKLLYGQLAILKAFEQKVFE